MPREALDKETKELTEELLYSKISVMAIAGNNVTDIAKSLNLSTYKIGRIMSTDGYKTHLKDLTEEVVSGAANTFKSQVAALAQDAIRVLKKNLDSGELEAVKLITRILGVEKQSEAVQNSNLTVVFPDSVMPPKDVKADIEV